MNKKTSVLMVVTSCEQIPQGEATGIWLEEFAVPYNEFILNDIQIQVASIKGGEAPVDPRSTPTEEQETLWAEAIHALKQTSALSSLHYDEFDAVFLPGGHGTMFDLPDNTALQNLLRTFAEQQKGIAAVCHGPAAFANLKLADNSFFIANRRLTGFTNDEEAAVGLTDKMPFLLESRLSEIGASFIAQENWADHVEVDGMLVTGQNPQSSKSTVRALIDILK